MPIKYFSEESDMNGFKMKTESGSEIFVSFTITENPGKEKTFGIFAKSIGEEEDFSEARNRFYTYEEAKACIKELVKYQVTPCTLCDVL